MNQPLQNSFPQGLRDGLPIGLGYLSVSFTFGIAAVGAGLPVWGAVLISMTNLTSAGQFAGLSLMAAAAPLVEMALTQLMINLRYALMSLSLSQRLDASVTLLDRALFAFCNTDEVFAVASAKPGLLARPYLLGLALMPYLGWSLGTLLGGVAGTLLPASVRSALGMAIYGMFLAIILPPAKYKASIGVVLALSVALSCLFALTPLSRWISSGFALILCTLLAAAAAAFWFPVPGEESAHE